MKTKLFCRLAGSPKKERKNIPIFRWDKCRIPISKIPLLPFQYESNSSRVFLSIPYFLKQLTPKSSQFKYDEQDRKTLESNQNSNHFSFLMVNVWDLPANKNMPEFLQIWCFSIKRNFHFKKWDKLLKNRPSLSSTNFTRSILEYTVS